MDLPAPSLPVTMATSINQNAKTDIYLLPMMSGPQVAMTTRHCHFIVSYWEDEKPRVMVKLKLG